MGHRQKTSQDYHELAQKRGFEWLGPEVSSVMTKTAWKCSQGHEWQAVFSKIQWGRGCPYCAGKAPKTDEDYHQLAREYDYKWLGPRPKNVHSKTWWECDQGHRREACYADLQQGYGCQVCYDSRRGESTRKKPEDYHELAEERGFRWLGPEVKKNKTDTTWECEEGHRWQAPYTEIQRGNGCRVCSGLSPKTPGDFYKLAEERGFKWLGPEVPNSRTKTTWECPKGHRWETDYSTIRRGCGCTECKKDLLGYINRIPPEMYHNLADQRGFKWLGPEVKSSSTNTFWQCSKEHIWEACYSNIKIGTNCPFCSGRAPKTKDDYHLLAYERGIWWIGSSVPETVSIKTTWQCKYGHKWRTPYGIILSGAGCPTCNESKGEGEIGKALSSWGIRFTRQKRFTACRSKKPLPFDFYFRVGDKRFLVEYHGIQHYKPIEYFGGKEALAQRQQSDQIKAGFAKNHGFVFLAISYIERENIRAILCHTIEKEVGRLMDEITQDNIPAIKGHKPTLDQYFQASFFRT